ncbi:hypothetical protein SGPA1_10528 [Streptomyces misionensis JCM 4497]
MMTATLRGGRFGMSEPVFQRITKAVRSIIAHLLRKDFI